MINKKLKLLIEENEQWEIIFKAQQRIRGIRKELEGTSETLMGGQHEDA